MKRFIIRIFFLAAIVVAGMATAKTIVVHDTDRQPVIAASVLDHNGVTIAMTDNNGCVTVSDRDYPLTIRALGLKNTLVDTGVDTVIMPWQPMELEEVVVDTQSRSLARVVCYVRETSGIIFDSDTTSLKWEGMVDYIIPIAKTKVKGHGQARLLNCRYTLTSTEEKIDTADVVECITFYHLVGYPCNVVRESEKLVSRTSGSDTVKLAKNGMIEELHSKTPVGYRVYNDFLANHKNHVWSPWIFKLIGFTIDAHEFAITQIYSPGSDGIHYPRDLKALTATIYMVGRGKWMRKAFGAKGDVNINSHVEIFPVDISFLTDEEGKELTRKKPKQAFILPSSLE